MKKTLRSAKYLAFGICFLALAPLASCSSDEDAPAQPEVTPARVLSPGEETMVQIVIPGIDNLTRATVDASTSEATISSLFFYAYPVEGSTGEFVGKDLKDESGTVGTSTYGTAYSVTMKAGKYRVYVVANLNTYGANLTASSDENALKAVVLKFNDLTTNKGILSNAIPMACLNTAIKKSQTETVTSGEFELNSTGQSIYADLTMLCAKVRYTVLFDLESYSEDVHYAKGVTFTKAEASNVKKQGGWIAAAGTDVQNAFAVNFDPKAYPTTTLQAYLNIGSQDTPPADLGTASWTDTEDDQQRAWQGTIYIPENAVDDASTQTTFTFTPGDGNFIGGTIKGKFERGNYYDFVAKITKAKVEFSDVNVYVKVKPWEYQPSEVQGW